MVPPIPPEQNHYVILGINITASSRDVKKAFTKLALTSHPDKHPLETPTKHEAAFLAARLAYEVLSDPISRAKYDARYQQIQAEWAQYEQERLAEAAKAKGPCPKPSAPRSDGKAFASTQNTRGQKRGRPSSAENGEDASSKRQKFNDNYVALKVGAQSVFVQGTMLTKRSVHFKALVKEAFRSAQAPEITISGFSSDVVAAYADYCHSDTIAAEWSADVRTSEGPSKINNKHIFLAQLYVFGEKHLDAIFCNDVMSAMTKACDEIDPVYGIGYYSANTVAIRTIYDGTQAGSPARRFLVDLFVVNKNSKDWLVKQGRKNYPRDFLFDLTQALLGLRAPIQKPPQYYQQRRRWFK